MKILVSDKLDADGLKILENSGFPVDVKTGMNEDELCSVIGGYDCIIIRSGTKVTAKVLASADKLKVIGRAGVGVDNIDVPTATEKGILVMNTPAANILSAAEHTCAMLLSVARNIPFAHASMHRGEWTRSKFTGVEMNGKILGIIGVGRVGGEVARRMKSFNMEVVGYDPFLPKEVADDIGVRLTTLDEVLQISDFMTIHTPLLPSTRNMISDKQFDMMKSNAMLANVARGGVVDEDALYRALNDGKIAAAAFDVWCNEPLNESEKKLLDLPNLVTTPHLGASTVEAQNRVAIEVATAAVKFLKDGIITNAINAPRGKLDPESAEFLPLAERMGAFVHKYNDKPIESLEIIYRGGLASKQTKMLTVSAVMGVIKGIVGEENANIINALPVAKQKGMAVTESKTDDCKTYSDMIEIKVTSGDKTTAVRGTVLGGEPRLVGLDGFSFNVPMRGGMMFLRYSDAPGVIGAVGTVLGKEKVNVAQMAVSRSASKALMIVTADQSITDSVLKEIANASDADEAGSVDMVND